MNKSDVVDKLNLLSDFESQRDLMVMEQQRLIDSLYTDDDKRVIAEIEARIAGQKAEIVEETSEAFAVVDSNIIQLTAQIKDMVLQIGESVKADNFHAVWKKGRTSWNTDALDGYILVHPELAQFRTTGKPSVSMNRVK